MFSASSESQRLKIALNGNERKEREVFVFDETFIHF